MNQLSFRKNKILFFVLIVLAVTFFSGCSKGVKVSGQGWMTENLNVDHYRNGDPIPEVKDSVAWSKLNTGAWCYYKNDPEKGKKYGKLYNWYAVSDPRGLAPNGLHVPTKKEFDKLIETVHGDGNALKAVGQGFEAGAGTNTSGFTALLAGCRYISGYFIGLRSDAEFWSSSEYDTIGAYRMVIVSPCNAVGIDMTSYDSRKGTGLSVRCIKDKP